MFDWLFPTYSACIFCGREDISSLDTGICSKCIKTAPFALEKDAAFYYDSDMEYMIQDLKYNNKRYLADIFARLSEEKIREIDYDIVCFVPTRNKKKRGYNQAELFARAIDKSRTVDALEKIKDTVSQTTLTREQRMFNVKDCFRVKDAKTVKDKDILLVDDVQTTRSTVNECKKELLKAGANRVYIFTICKTKLKDAMY